MSEAREVRALLLTDVVDSTRLAEELGDARMAEVWLAHDRAARALLETHGGREIDKSDGMLLLFASAAAAVPFAIGYQRALAALPVPLKARVGLHLGPVTLRENSDADIARGAKRLEVEGLAKPIAARVMALAGAGQTLLTSEARSALGPTDLRLVSHGHWQVKGINEPLEIFQIGEAGDVFVPPADGEKAHRVVQQGDWWLPVKNIPNNLPFQATSFIGRERELSEVKALLGHSRSITLLGMGGLGKTRLSLQVAAELIHEYPDGVWFLDLAPLRDSALLVPETAQVLGVREEPEQSLLRTLCGHLKPLRALLILDNCEHLIRATAELVHAVLRAAPQVRILASSREALRTPGEQAYPVLPLPVPAQGDGVEALLHSTAVCLFLDRARLHKPGFVLTDREAPGVAELVARLEGIPLALELAAARLRSLSVADINARLKDRYKLLTGGARVLQERQQTLRALVDWSYELLAPTERTVLGRLAVFIGGFDLPAAEAVCAGDAVAAEDVLDQIGSLVEKSLVMLEERDDGTRYRMLETIREYAHEKLEQGGDLAAVSVRHCNHYFAMAKAASYGLEGPGQADWIWRVETEIDNIRTAMALTLSGGTDALMAVKFTVAMRFFWTLRGYSSEGRKLVKAALALPEVGASDVAQAWGLYVGAGLAESQSDHAEARQMLETCLQIRRRLGHAVDIAATLSTLSLARLHGGDPAGAEACEREAIAIFRQSGDQIGEAIGLLHLGQVALYLGDTKSATGHFDSCLLIARAISYQEIQGECELSLGEVAFCRDDLAQAEVHFKRSLTICREAGDKRGETNAEWWLGKLDLRAGEIAPARNRLGRALVAFRSFEMREELLGCLEDHALLACSEGKSTLGANLVGVVDTLRRRLALARPARIEQSWVAHVGAWRHTLGVDAFTRAFDDGAAWPIERAILSARLLYLEPAAATA
jgi:predicted ATPase/class 3 adenylate cyclase